MEKTSTQIYEKIQKVIDLLDEAFFSGEGKHSLPELVFAINDKCNSCVTAYVAPDALYDKQKARKLQYLAINPKYLDRDLSSILATICHELCHVYENAYIHIARGGYHDRAWANLMTDCGLEPVFLNKSKTAVGTTVKEGGVFASFVEKFTEEYGADYFNIVSYSRETERKVKVALGLTDEDLTDTPVADNADKPIKKYNRNKIKYVCPDCEAKVWGKAGLNILCSDCNTAFFEEENDTSDRH